MDEIKAYSKKEIAIFEGIFDLLRQGRSLHELKVADIAAAAGMGKSTVYEYYPSKADIISEAICYIVNNEMQVFKQFVAEQDSFECMLEHSMDYMIDMFAKRFISIMVMGSNLNYSEFMSVSQGDDNLLQRIEKGLYEQSEVIYRLAHNEKMICDHMASEDCRMIIIGMLSAFSYEARYLIFKGSGGFFHPSSKEVGKDVEISDEMRAELEELKKRTIRVILKALA